MPHRRRLVAAFLSLLVPGSVTIAAEPGNGIEARLLTEEVASALRIDGQFDDRAWDGAAVITEFVQRDPREGAPATFPTEVRVAYDRANIYIAARAFDPEPARLVGFLTRRDADSSSDWIRILIDSYHDRRTAYEFSVNVAGVKQDQYWFNDGSSDDSWDAVWDVVVTRDGEGWRAEFRIPFSQLRFGAARTGPLGFAVVREVARLNEISTWPLLARSANGYVSNFGELTGVAVPGASKRLELVPYTVAQIQTEPRERGNPLQNTFDPGASMGMDLKYALTPALTINATLNPDFGQVEADPAVVNLSAFETFFAERRPFFVEGSGNYRFDVQCNDGNCTGLFYSRRIGRQPRGAPDVTKDDGGYFVSPLQSTILGAGKVTGRVGRFSVGVLSAATQEERARVAQGTERRIEVIEPLTVYSIARARREFVDQSSLGFMVTSTNRRMVDSLSFLPDGAVTGGVDYDWRLGRRWSLQGHWAGSTVRGSATAITDLQQNNVHSFQRPDADHVELDTAATSLNGHAGQVQVSKIAGERIRLTASVAYRSPGFEINDLGFLRRADEIPQSSWIQFRFDRPGQYVRSTRVNFNQWSTHNFAGDRLALGGNVNAHWVFQNLWSAGGGVNLNARTFDDRLTRGGPGGYRNGEINSWQYVNTNDRRRVSLHLNTFVMNDGHGSRSIEASPRLAMRPSPALYGELGLRWTSNVRDAQWVERGGDETTPHYVFGRLDQHTASITTRVNYTITPNLSLQLYGQPFVSTGHYEHYKELRSGRALRHEERYAPFSYNGNADFRVLSFRTTNVLRWEFKPGSTLFVVWQQGREQDLDGGRARFRVGHDFREVFSTGAANTVLMKVAYWVNP